MGFSGREEEVLWPVGEKRFQFGSGIFSLCHLIHTLECTSSSQQRAGSDLKEPRKMQSKFKTSQVSHCVCVEGEVVLLRSDQHSINTETQIHGISLVIPVLTLFSEFPQPAGKQKPVVANLSRTAREAGIKGSKLWPSFSKSLCF